MKKRTQPEIGGMVMIALALTLVLSLLNSCQAGGPQGTKPASEGISADATTFTARANSDVLKQLNFSDRADFDDAQRGFIATIPGGVIKGADGSPIWDLTAFDFLKQQDAPPTVNPLLWRMAQLNLNNGLFQVTDRIYQVRSLDVANMTIVEGDNKIIVIDTLSSIEASGAGLDLYYQQRGQKPIAAVIYTHSHIDHFGGARGLISDEDVRSGAVQVIAPDGFLENAISENIMAGTAMGRRSSFQFGNLLPRGEKGMVDSGVGKAYGSGAFSIMTPSDTIKSTGEKRVIDGVEMVFQMTPGTEAPAEMTIYFPAFRAFDSAELACPLMHNVLTPRGAQVRDANGWAKYLNEAIDLYGDKTDVLFAQHSWPRWGGDRIVSFLKDQRDMYKYLHDQTLRLINHGYTMDEIAETVKLPDSLAKQWYAHGYYGTVSFNVKAIYQRYLGWYDGNPAHLSPLPPVESGKKYVEYMGGPQAVIEMARKDFDKGEYRWVVQVMNQVVFAYPENREARYLEADALEQLGYQAESGTWRSSYLQAANELRNGAPPDKGKISLGRHSIKALTLPMYFDLMAMRLDGPKAEGKRIIVNWDFTDAGEKYVLNLENCALTCTPGRLSSNADATLTLTRATLDSVTAGDTTFPKEITAGNIKVSGNALKLAELMGLLDSFDWVFNVVTP